MIQIPQHFMIVRYDGSCFPGAPGVIGLKKGANCQQFAYELLRHFGHEVPNLRSSDLWEDEVHTARVQDFKPFDLLFFSADGEAWGAHVGVYLGDGKVIHLSAAAGLPEIQDLPWFQETLRYRVLLGAKRCRVRAK
jgi:lipoprotein Spr